MPSCSASAALGYGVSIWLDMVALASLGAAREAHGFTAQSIAAVGGGRHGHWHRHAERDHQHRHFHTPVDGDAHHLHPHQPEDLADLEPGQPFWHSHRHGHDPLANEHPHVSDVHHRHQH
ncbi:hypothetical protein [Synechococcus sp. CCY 0621]|uniref:hypothetical protein n=1 Tax=Synechococcus sp. CCY 0621 TaxID=2815603 RepID=UPI0025700620|nr:hypothetical protein [Synechococcus sp. CCY 0621]